MKNQSAGIAAAPAPAKNPSTFPRTHATTAIPAKMKRNTPALPRSGWSATRRNGTRTIPIDGRTSTSPIPPYRYFPEKDPPRKQHHHEEKEHGEEETVRYLFDEAVAQEVDGEEAGDAEKDPGQLFRDKGRPGDAVDPRAGVGVHQPDPAKDQRDDQEEPVHPAQFRRTVHAPPF